MVIAVSALTGEGLPDLLKAVEDRIAAGASVFRVKLEGDALGRLHRLYELGEVIDRDDRKDGETVARVRVPQEAVTRFRHEFPSARLTR